MLKAIIFDFDGTIADTKDISYLVFLELAKRYDVPIISKEEFHQLSEISLAERFKKFQVPIYKLPKLVKKAIPIFRKHVRNASLFPEMKAVLETLKQEGFRLFILSSNKKHNIVHFIRQHNLDMFEQIEGGASIFGKDKRIKKLLKKQKLTAEDAIYVGDEERDIVSCKKANIPIISVTWGYDNKNILTQNNPDYLVESPKELLSTIHLHKK